VKNRRGSSPRGSRLRGSSPTVKEGSSKGSSALLNSRATAPKSTAPKSTAPKSTAPNATAPITLLTDFGTADYYVGAVKGVVLSINPSATIVDLTHDIPPHDIEAGAFVLLGSYRSFPKGTIHIGVVDPGVGSARRPIIVCAGDQLFIGPDNGLFSYVLDCEVDCQVFHAVEEKYFRQPVSTTFHGRDVFGPIAAELSNGVAPDSFGPQIKDAVRLPSLKPEVLKKGKVKGRIIHIDRFGNCVTNIDRGVEVNQTTTLRVNGKTIESFREFYGEGKKRSKLFAIWGSAGFLEISAQNRSAAKMLKAKRGDAVVVVSTTTR